MGWPVKIRSLESGPSGVRPARVLLGTEDNGLRALLSHLLKRNRYEVVGVTSGTQIVKYLLGARVRPARMPMPDIIIVDDAITDQNVNSLLTFLQRVHPNLPVIVLTSAAMSEDGVAEEQLSAGQVVARVSKKPVRWTSLSRQIERIQTPNDYDVP